MRPGRDASSRGGPYVTGPCYDQGVFNVQDQVPTIPVRIRPRINSGVTRDGVVRVDFVVLDECWECHGLCSFRPTKPIES